jgi:hypothetical protein
MQEISQEVTGSKSESYVPSDTKRPRRTKDTVAGIKKAIVEILEADHPQTVRQVFYALTVRGLIDKRENEYHRTVVRLLVEMREAGTIPFNYIADNTRWMRKPATFTGLDSCLESTAKFYRRNLWASMPVYVEVWIEKDALISAQRCRDDRSEGQALLHLPFRRLRPERPGRGPRHRS